jgi:hypothetical protein
MTTVDDAGVIAVRMTRRVKRRRGSLEMSIVGEGVIIQAHTELWRVGGIAFGCRLRGGRGLKIMNCTTLLRCERIGAVHC